MDFVERQQGKSVSTDRFGFAGRKTGRGGGKAGNGDAKGNVQKCVNKRKEVMSMSKGFKKISALVLCAFMMNGCFAYAEELPTAEMSLQPAEMMDLTLETVETEEAVEGTFENFPVDESLMPEITRTANKNERSQSFIQNGVLSLTDSLTAADPNDLYLFSISNDRFMNLTIESSNPNYVVIFAVVDYATGSVTPINAGAFAGEIYQLNGFPAGDWGLYVYSTDGSVGDDYTIKCNFANPAGNLRYYLSDDYKQCMIQLKSTNKIYDNGNTINWNAINGVDIKWESHDSWPAYNEGDPTHPGTEYLDMTIQEGTVRSVGYGSFVTNRMNIPHALFVNLDVDTLWTYKNSIVVGGDYYMTMKDLYGYDTPRRLNYDDVRDPEGAPVCMIFDLDTGKYVNFYSNLNKYFAGGGEKQISGGLFGYE